MLFSRLFERIADTAQRLGGAEGFRTGQYSTSYPLMIKAGCTSPKSFFQTMQPRPSQHP